jgi:adenine-specific DNA methylase
MIPKVCKRLAEIDFPIAVVSSHAAREKSIRHGHPFSLHLWWARRPLASCRAMLLALLLPDPCDPNCPSEFKTKARQLLKKLSGVPEGDEGLRTALFNYIGDVANWDVANHPRWIGIAKDLVKLAYPEDTPLVVDPFSGGGSIPLEALRLGCDAFASDLNPVAYLINKVLLEDVPRQGPELADKLREAWDMVRSAAEDQLTELYPVDRDGARPITYLWARTIRCEAPNCGAEIPLIRSFWLSKKSSRRRALKANIVRKTGSSPQVEFVIFEPKSERDVAGGTVTRAKATCLCCNSVTSPDRVRSQLADQRGGANVFFDEQGKRIGGARLMAVVTLRPGESGRKYRLPTDWDHLAVRRAQERLKAIEMGARTDGLSPVPDEAIPRTELRRISLPIYGIDKFSDMYTARQLVSLAQLSRNVASLAPGSIAANRILSLCLGKTADLNNANSRWEPIAECPRQTLARHDIPMSWDFAEAVPISDSSGSMSSIVKGTAAALPASTSLGTSSATLQQSDACDHPLPDSSASVWFTDPPYYDAVPYAHLSDFFYIWHRRALLNAAREYPNALAPKKEECVADRPHRQIPDAKTGKDFEARIGQAMREGFRITRPDGIACVVFAHKTTEGWEALLSGMISAGWTITGSWPVLTEMQSRLNARDNASLATSVHLICRPRPEDAPIGDWGDVLRELPARVHDWMGRLESEGVHGADLVFACIGPALEIYSRYSRVVDAEDCEIPLGGDPAARVPHLRGYLAYVWEIVGRSALEEVLGTAESKARNGVSGALEEDARLSALFLWTLETTSLEANLDTDTDIDEDVSDDGDEESTAGPVKGFTLVYDVVRRFAQPLGIHLDAWEGRIIETKKGVVRLLPVSERAELLFGKDGASAVADRIEKAKESSGQLQMTLWPEAENPPKIKGRKVGRPKASDDTPDPSIKAQRATTLDRVHAAMLLQSSGRTNALRALLKDEVERGPDFLRLSNALSALYPQGSEEKRLIEAMLLAVPR